MKFLPFVLKHLLRNWIRSASTMVAMALCVFLYCTLQSVLSRFNRVVDTRSPRRLVTHNERPTVVLPGAGYAEQIAGIAGVRRVAVVGFFGGVLTGRKEQKADEAGTTDWADVFQNAAVDAESYFGMSPELMVAPNEFQEFMKDQRGCVIGRELAGKFGWKIGDHFFLESIFSLYRSRGGPLEFVIRGFIDANPSYAGVETGWMFFHFNYLKESLGGSAYATNYLVEIDDPARGAEIGATIDALFENSSQPTLTETEKAWAAEFMSMAGDLGVMVQGIGLAVCFTILLVTANTMSMAVRERRGEIAILKTLGFTGAQVMGLIVAEALSLGALGGALGVGGTQALLFALSHGTNRPWMGLSGIELRPLVALAGFGTAMWLGFVAGFMPAWSAYRAKVTDMLRVV
ncbi:MAG: FtsX-like permease family protein [Vicinamibacteria bacterium]